MTATTDFWTSRKAGVKAEAEADIAALAAEQEIAERNALEEKSDEEMLAELELPDPDELESGDDFSAFMEKAVPDRIRRRALRKLWLSNPTLANIDGLVDYGEDYTDAATVVANMQTAYQVGKGMLKHVMQMARADEEAASGVTSNGEPAIEDDSVAEVMDASDEKSDLCEIEDGIPESVEEPIEAFAESSDEAGEISQRRRMHFSFSTEIGAHKEFLGEDQIKEG